MSRLTIVPHLGCRVLPEVTVVMGYRVRVFWRNSSMALKHYTSAVNMHPHMLTIWPKSYHSAYDSERSTQAIVKRMLC